MYSLRVQLLFPILLAGFGGFLAHTYGGSPWIAAALFAVCLLLSIVLLHFFVYRPIRQIQRVLASVQDKQSAHRVFVNSSDEFQKIADSFNQLLDSFREDIGQREKLERVRSEFLGNVSHELRTPLFSTQGLIETLLHGAVDDKKVNRDFLKKALNNIERLNSLLEELIDISRIESGEMKLRLRYFDIVPVVASAVSESQSHADQRKIELRIADAPKEPIEVFGDSERIRQVLVNLIENGIKYSEKGDTVTVRCVPRNNVVELSVEDTGIGIAPQHLPRIFERFYRVDKDRSRDVGGSGLGLAIVKHIIEAHDSSITVESAVGVGTKFSFVLSKSSFL